MHTILVLNDVFDLLFILPIVGTLIISFFDIKFLEAKDKKRCYGIQKNTVLLEGFILVRKPTRGDKI